MMWQQIHYLRSMERNDAKPLKAAIQQFIRAHRMQGKLDEVDVVKAWGVVFGVFVEKQTRSCGCSWMASCGSNSTAALSKKS